MNLLKKLAIRNFKCFRDWEVFELHPATYICGANNSGKTAVLAAIACFFDSDNFVPDYINKTELTARREGYNRSEIRIVFDLGLVTGRVRKERLISAHGTELEITKIFTWREASETLEVTYRIGRARRTEQYDDLNQDVRHLLGAVSVSYLHPQEGLELLRKAQDKFKRRLFHNWGRHPSVAERVNAIQTEWEALKSTANSYLSSALTTRLRDIWPAAEVKVELPERIQDIVAVSDITFRSSPNLPQVTLPSHGTGAQSTILYQTHYIMDSDRSLHQGMYFPVWLLEEPESFLHADMAIQLARLLSSPEWLSSIQMVIATHSPIILAGSRQQEQATSWVVVDNHKKYWQSTVDCVSEAQIEEVGNLMGDANFSTYFESSTGEKRVFIEDSRASTEEKLVASGIPVTKGIGGIAEVERYISVLSALGQTVAGQTYFIVDGDQGLQRLRKYVANVDVEAVDGGWQKLKLAERVYLVILPEGCAVEDLSDEWIEVINACLGECLDEHLKIKTKVPADLSRLVASLRSRSPGSLEDARAVARASQDVKDRFWSQSSDWCFKQHHVDALLRILDV